MKPRYPRACEMALADLCRFGRLERFGDMYAATRLHLPELGHEPKAISVLVSDGLAAEAGQSVQPTPAGRAQQAAIQAAMV